MQSLLYIYAIARPKNFSNNFKKGVDTIPQLWYYIIVKGKEKENGN